MDSFFISGLQMPELQVFLDSLIKKRINEPLIPVSENFGDNLAECVCYNSDVVLLQKQLKEMNRFQGIILRILC